MIDTMGVILTSNADTDLGELTRLRSVAAIPFGGRYRLVDFVLSNLVNSGIVNVGVATEYNYQSLLDHIGSGKPWGLARKQFGLRFLPPFSANSNETDEILETAKEVRDLEPDEYINKVFPGVYEHIEEIDRLISENSVGWSIKRISKTALCILRLAIYEMKYFDEIPVSVSINEAVELCKKYATNDDASFVNGILATVSKSL